MHIELSKHGHAYQDIWGAELVHDDGTREALVRPILFFQSAAMRMQSYKAVKRLAAKLKPGLPILNAKGL